MFNKEKLKEILIQYKNDFNLNQWEKERYKWQAIKVFQDNWDINADYFAEMLEKALDGTANLLTSRYYYARAMIIKFAQFNSDKVRKMFKDLFDEETDLVTRVNKFKEDSVEILRELNENQEKTDKNHYQTENSISTYLWLYFPDKYYIYKLTEQRNVSKVLNSDLKFKNGAHESNLINCNTLYDSIRKELKEDNELIEMFNATKSDLEYSDPDLVTLTIDVGYYISSQSKKSKENIIDYSIWQPVGYSPDLDVEDWVALLNNPSVFFKGNLEMLKRMKDMGGEASCKYLSDKYGEKVGFYNIHTSKIGKRIAEETGCPLEYESYGQEQYWPVQFQGKIGGDGTFIYKLRDELSEALNQVDLSHIELYSTSDDKLNSDDLIVKEESSQFNTVHAPYSKSDFLEEVFMSKEQYNRLENVLKFKKNIILQGAPGVGKTFVARRLAYAIIGAKAENQIEFVQFHQNYSYEDFMMGYRPSGDGFELENGVFYNFCKEAENTPDKDFFFIIDEINRGNLSKIFGELLMLIEKEYRGTEATLVYNKQKFSVPKNLYIIGMMNTADRSLAMIDYALRRRFGFIEIEPGFDSTGFKQYQSGIDNVHFDKTIMNIKNLNEDIKQDNILGKGFCIGHSYFSNINHDEDVVQVLRNIVDYEILPMINEYWFDDQAKFEEWSKKLSGDLNDSTE